jgi:peptidoglycan/LPS O-acetylase OafA/YrhL
MLTFTHNPNWTGYAAAVGWTLHAEFWFYVCFPFIFALTYRCGLLPLAIGLLIVTSVLAKIFAGHGEPAKWLTGNDQWLTVIYLDQLMYGALCAFLIARQSPAVELFASRWWFWGTLLISLAMGKLLPFKGYDVYWYLKTSGAALLCAIAILHHAARPKMLMTISSRGWAGFHFRSISSTQSCSIIFRQKKYPKNWIPRPSFSSF